MADALHAERHCGNNGGRRPTSPRDNEGSMASRNIPDTGEPIVRTFDWLRWADSDYLAARYLLLGRMVVQGCVLANTAIEKYLKALHAHLELPISRSHAVEALYAELKNSAKSTVTLNQSFLRVLQKAYRLRYPDDLPDGFNISLNHMKVLAELDRTVFAISRAFTFSDGTTDPNRPSRQRAVAPNCPFTKHLAKAGRDGMELLRFSATPVLIAAKAVSDQFPSGGSARNPLSHQLQRELDAHYTGRRFVA